MVFTSVLDDQHNPHSTMVANPYDWNGIYVHPDALGSVFDHVVVQYSVYGLVSETKFIRVDPGTFRSNGKSNLVIEGTERVQAEETVSHVLSTKDATVDGVPVKLLRDPAAPRRNTVRYGGLALLTGGVAMGVVEVIQTARASDRMDELSNTNTATSQGYNNLRYNDSDDWEETQNTHTWSLVGAIAGFAVGTLGATGLVWSFTF